MKELSFSVKGEIDGRNISLPVMRVLSELSNACKKHAAFNSAHEGWAVIKEEVDELWEEVRKRREIRDVKSMEDEAIQIAAMAIRFMLDVCGKKVT